MTTIPHDLRFDSETDIDAIFVCALCQERFALGKGSVVKGDPTALPKGLNEQMGPCPGQP